MTPSSYLPILLALLLDLRLAHWRANSITSEHRILGELYDTLDPLVDQFAEVALGRLGTHDIPASGQIVMHPVTSADLLNNAQAALAALYKTLPADAPDLQNIAADMLASVNRARYLLMLPNPQ